MSTATDLRREVNEIPKGVYAPYYFRYMGFREAMAEPAPIFRASAIKSLFENTTPYIFVNDLIAGNTRGLYVEENPILLEYASDFVKNMGKRNFRTNADHFAPDYRDILVPGIKGLRKKIEASLKKYGNDEKKTYMLSAMKLTVDAFWKMIENYMLKAQSLKNDSRYNAERLDFIAENCRVLLEGPPETFAQALQLVWFCHTAFMLEERLAMALGRIDQYLYPFYKSDIENGILTKEDAICLLENTFTKIPTNDATNICIGGMDTDGNCQVNELSYCVLEAVKRGQTPGTNLSARITQNVPDKFLEECLKSIGTGLGYPALMNDEVNIAALSRYGYDKEDVYNYSMVGCIENFITGKQPPWSDNRFDTPRFFDYVFNNGISEFNKSAGINTGDVEDIKSMDEFMEKFKQQLAAGAKEYYAAFSFRNNSINQDFYPEPFLSCFCDDCIERGMDINNGGTKYPSVHAPGLMGIGTVADSLAAVEKVVFTDKEATLSELRDAMNCNFEGYEELHKKLLKAPKYGNNDDFVDKYAVWFLDYLSSLFTSFKTRDGGRFYVAMASNINNVFAGEITSATPDGRKRGEPYSDAASPTFGKDLSGVTSTLISVAKPDYTKVACGSVVNQKFTPSAFEGVNLQKLLTLVKTYFKLGGQEIQINATSRDDLIAALENPEQYKSLVVRVSGYSDYYVRLKKGVQLDILSRTQQNL